MSWYTNIRDNMSLEDILSKCGHVIKGKRFKDCPVCGASRTKRDSRPPVGIFGKKNKKRWHCNACHTNGNKWDIISLFMFGCLTEQLENFEQLKDFDGASSTSYTPSPKIEIKEPEYPPEKEVLHCLRKGVKHLKDVNITPKLEEFLKRRGLKQSKIPCGIANPKHGCWDDITKVKSSNNKETFWWPRKWTREYALIFPLVDHHGNIKSLLGRTWYNALNRKTTVPISYTTKGLLLANHQARKWMKEREPVEEVIICEGEMDYATACQEYDGIVIGIRSGSIDVCRQLPWFAQTTVYIATDDDVVGNTYAKKIAQLVGEATPMRVRFGNE